MHRSNHLPDVITNTVNTLSFLNLIQLPYHGEAINNNYNNRKDEQFRNYFH